MTWPYPNDSTVLAEEQQDILLTPIDVDSPLIDLTTALQVRALEPPASRRGALQG